MPTGTQRSAIPHSVRFVSLLPTESGRVGVKYTHHTGWFTVFPSIDDASFHLGIGRDEVAGALNTPTELSTIVPVIDAGELSTLSGQPQTKPRANSSSGSFDKSVETACLPRTEQSQRLALRESWHANASGALVSYSYQHPPSKRSHRRQQNPQVTQTGRKPRSQRALNEANSQRARRLYVYRADKRSRYELRLPEGATLESKDGQFLSFASIGDASNYVGENPVGKAGIRTCILKGKENNEPFIVVMSHDKAFCEQAGADTAGVYRKWLSVRHPEKDLWLKAGPIQLPPGYISTDADADEVDG